MQSNSGMANRTVTEKIALLETERDRLETAISSQQSGLSSFAIDGQSYTNWRVSDLSAELTRVEKSLQRLYRGGRGFVIDMSQAAGTTASPETIEYVKESV